jgi:hypothetical protein
MSTFGESRVVKCNNDLAWESSRLHSTGDWHIGRRTSRMEMTGRATRASVAWISPAGTSRKARLGSLVQRPRHRRARRSQRMADWTQPRPPRIRRSMSSGRALSRSPLFGSADPFSGGGGGERLRRCVDGSSIHEGIENENPYRPTQCHKIQ